MIPDNMIPRYVNTDKPKHDEAEAAHARWEAGRDA